MRTRQPAALPKPPLTRRSFRHTWDEIAYVVDKTVYWLYRRKNPRRARIFEHRLGALLESVPRSDYPVVGALGWSILEELRGNTRAAIQHRKRLIRRVHGYVHRTGGRPRWELRIVLGSEYGYVMYGRLAELYGQGGQYLKGKRVLEQSKAFCKKYRLRFECQDLPSVLEIPSLYPSDDFELSSYF